MNMLLASTDSRQSTLIFQKLKKRKVGMHVLGYIQHVKAVKTNDTVQLSQNKLDLAF